MVCICLPILSACSLTPVYKQQQDASGAVVSSLPPLQLHVPRSRIGQQFRTALEDALATPEDTPPAAYQLHVLLEQKRYPIGIEQSGRISRYNVSITAQYRLIPVGEVAPVFEGKVRKLTSYNIVQSDYASYIAERDAESRAIQQAAQELRRRLMVFFATPQDSKPMPG